MKYAFSLQKLGHYLIHLQLNESALFVTFPKSVVEQPLWDPLTECIAIVALSFINGSCATMLLGNAPQNEMM